MHPCLPSCFSQAEALRKAKAEATDAASREAALSKELGAARTALLEAGKGRAVELEASRRDGLAAVAKAVKDAQSDAAAEMGAAVERAYSDGLAAQAAAVREARGSAASEVAAAVEHAHRQAAAEQATAVREAQMKATKELLEALAVVRDEAEAERAVAEVDRQRAAASLRAAHGQLAAAKSAAASAVQASENRVAEAEGRAAALMADVDELRATVEQAQEEMKAHIEKSGGNQRLSQLSYDLRRTEAQLTARQRQARLEREDAARREQRLSDAEQKELEAYRRSARDVLALTAPSPDHQPPAAWSQWNATASVSRASSVFSTPVGGAAGHPPRVTSSASARLSNRDRSASLRS